MTDAFWVALFGAIPTCFAALAARKAAASAKEASNKNAAKLEQVEEKLNGHLTERIREAEDKARKFRPPQILIVDDDPRDIESIVRIGERLSCQFISIPQPWRVREALLKRISPTRGYPFDLVLVDLRLPSGDAGEVFQIFDELAPPVPIVIITGLPDPGIIEKLGKHYPVEMLVKPVDERLFIRLLQNHQIPFLYPEQRHPL